MCRVILSILIILAANLAVAGTSVDIFTEIQRQDQELRQEINKQSERFGHSSEEVAQLWQKQNELDAANQVKIADFLRKEGWPTSEQYPDGKASHTVWLVVQHAPLSYQQEFYDLALVAYFNGDLHPYSFALLIDRIRVNAGKPQIFGSQLQSNKDDDGYHFPTILDKAHVNKRRAFVEMDSIEEYAKRNGITYQ